MIYPQCLLFSSSAIDNITFDNEKMSIKFKGKNKIYNYKIDEHFLSEIILLTNCSVGQLFNRYKPSLNLIQ